MMGQTTADLCDNCEYGRRFVDLGECPECGKGRIVGDTHTRRIFCSELHPITAVAVDFCGKKNCEQFTLWQEYSIRLCPPFTGKQLDAASRFFDMPRSQIYLAAKTGTPIERCFSFVEMLTTGAGLAENGISFQTEPPFPILWHFADCFPALAENYLQILNTKVPEKAPEGGTHEPK